MTGQTYLDGKHDDKDEAANESPPWVDGQAARVEQLKVSSLERDSMLYR